MFFNLPNKNKCVLTGQRPAVEPAAPRKLIDWNRVNERFEEDQREKWKGTGSHFVVYSVLQPILHLALLDDFHQVLLHGRLCPKAENALPYLIFQLSRL